jgi:glycosyltransferase involved in cell wall biosynthesis
VLIDYVVPYGLRESEGRSNSLICKLQCLAELRDDYHFRLFAPFCDYSPKLPKNVTLISQKRLASRLLQELFLNAKYLCYLLRKRPQCLIVRPDALFTAHFFAKLAKARLVLNIHSYPREEYKYVYSNIVGKAYTRAVDAIFSLSVKLADGIIFNHPDLQEYITHKYSYEHQTEFIYNGADTTRFYPMDKCSARRTLSISTDKAILLFLGSVAKWHGIEYLIEIASVLQAKSNDILMYIVYEGPCRSCAEECDLYGESRPRRG